MIYTKELLLNNSAFSKIMKRQNAPVKGVLSIAEQNKLAEQHRSFQVISDGKVFWFTDDYNMVYKLLPPVFVSSSTICPHNVAPRASLPEGVVSCVEDYVKIYHHDERHIQTIEELIDYLTAYY